MPQDARSIAELIADHRDRTGDSYGDMAAKSGTSAAGGEALTRAAFQRMGSLPPKAFPDPQTITALARVLDVPVTTVVLAAATSLGLPVHADAEAMWLPAGTEQLTAEDRAAIRAVTRALVDARTADIVVTDASGRVHSVVEVKQGADPGPISGPEPGVQYDYTLAARRGPSEGRRLRREQDDDAESQ